MRIPSFTGGCDFHRTLPAKVQEIPCRRAEAQPIQASDSFHSVQDNTFLIPPKSQVVVIPGMFSSKPSIDDLSAYLKSQGHTVYPTLLADILGAQSTDHARKILAKKIDNIRIPVAAKNSVDLAWQLGGKNRPQQQQVIQQFFQLEKTAKGRAVADAILDMLQDPDLKLLDTLQKLHPEEVSTTPDTPESKDKHSIDPDGELGFQLGPIVRNSQTQLRNNMRQSRNPSLQTLDAEERIKISNTIMDMLIPRVVVIGHSLGGFVATRELLRDRRDVSMVISLGSPVKGTPGSRLLTLQAPQIPDALVNLGASSVRPVIRKFLQAIIHMAPDSPEVRQIQNSKLPFDTFAFSVSSPKDGLVGPENAAHNEALGNRLNLVVSPREADFKILFATDQRKRLELMGRLNPVKPVQDRISNTAAVAGVKQHMGLLEHFDNYWTFQGDMSHQVLENPDRIRLLLKPANNDAMRAQLLKLMYKELQVFPEAAPQYKELIPDLQSVSKEERPFTNGVDTLAKQVLAPLN